MLDALEESSVFKGGMLEVFFRHQELDIYKSWNTKKIKNCEMLYQCELLMFLLYVFVFINMGSSQEYLTFYQCAIT